MATTAGSLETCADVKAYINEFGGEAHVLAIMFDNNIRVTWCDTSRKNLLKPEDSSFTFARFLNEKLNAVTIRQVDDHGNFYMSLHPISNIQVIFMRRVPDLDPIPGHNNIAPTPVLHYNSKYIIG